MKFNPIKLKRKLNYLPKWAWYLGSFLLLGPIGLLIVYLAFHVLNRMIEDYKSEQRQQAAASRQSPSFYQDEECTVSDDTEIKRRQQTQDPTAQAENAPHQESADSELAGVIREGRDAMRKIRHANDLIPDPLLSEKIDSIENSCGQILSILEQRPELLPQLRTFLRYYLPAALRLLDARAKLESTANTPKAREIRSRISDALGVIDKAFLKQVEALDEFRFIDLESEMDALRDMLRADGLLDEEENKALDDPFASVLSQRSSGH